MSIDWFLKLALTNQHYNIEYRKKARPSRPDQHPNPIQKTKLDKIVAYFKYQSTKLINEQRDQIGVKLWQRKYYEHNI